MAETSINKKLLYFGISRHMGRHGFVCNVIRVVVFIKFHGFGIGFWRPDNPVGVFGVVFGDKGFDTGWIKDSLFALAESMAYKMRVASSKRLSNVGRQQVIEENSL